MPNGLRTHYEVLGVPPSASGEDIRQAYRGLAREYHPDLNPEDPHAHERMALLNEAFETLSDPLKRTQYDGTLGLTREDADPSGFVKRPSVVQARLVQRHRVHRTPIYAMAFRSIGGQMLTSGFDNEVLQWDRDLAKVEKRYPLEGGAVSSLAALSDGFLAAGSTEQTVSAWRQSEAGTQFWRHHPPEWSVAVAACPDGSCVALGTVGKEARILDARTGRDRFLLRGHKDSVTAVAFSGDGRTLATGSADATVRLWNARTGTQVRGIERIRSTVTAIAFHPDGSRVAVAAVDRSIRVFDTRTSGLLTTFFGHERPIETLAFHPRGWLLASGSRDGTVGLWNIDRGLGHGRIEASHQAVMTVGFHPEGRFMVAGGLDKILRVWRLGGANA